MCKLGTYAMRVAAAIITEMSDKQRERILRNVHNYEYVIVKTSVFNTGVTVKIKLTNTYVQVRNTSGYDFVANTADMARWIRKYNNNTGDSKNNS